MSASKLEKTVVNLERRLREEFQLEIQRQTARLSSRLLALEVKLKGEINVDFEPHEKDSEIHEIVEESLDAPQADRQVISLSPQSGRSAAHVLPEEAANVLPVPVQDSLVKPELEPKDGEEDPEEPVSFMETAWNLVLVLGPAMVQGTRPLGRPEGASVEVEADSEASGARRSIFSKTKMCKFHLLGVCAKGSSCIFAHCRDELRPAPDLLRTKICKTLINTGACHDPQCRFAHNRDELRSASFGRVPSPRGPHQRLQREPTEICYAVPDRYPAQVALQLPIPAIGQAFQLAYAPVAVPVSFVATACAGEGPKQKPQCRGKVSRSRMFSMDRKAAELLSQQSTDDQISTTFYDSVTDSPPSTERCAPGTEAAESLDTDEELLYCSHDFQVSAGTKASAC